MHRELALLGLLRQQKTHGYQLHEFINRYLDSCTDIKRATAYALLDKMAEANYIEVHHEEQQGRRPKRRIYRITAAGEAHFQHLLRQNLAQYHPIRFADDIGLAFMDALSPEEALQLLQHRHTELTDHLEQISSTHHPSDHTDTLHFVLKHYRWHLQSELEWLDQLIEELAAKL